MNHTVDEIIHWARRLFLIGPDPVDPKESTPEGEKALACLAWAASDMQAHKATRMPIADALRCAFDAPSIPGPAEYVASLEAIPCR
jgi:hypothetical protein